ncbi:MBL fold metallo-hydrolase [Clostridium beijerinckii]|uniref:MBL fold metallo-hydrolase n=1 Tax=Clostridium beijerinckii TaxID=1520 RepID=UPI0022E41BA6|nr:MBL fold metallo-hydrolase [Clostridium beijerinckii]
MSTGTARITYLYNSGFAVETDEHLLIFDYCLNTPVGNVRQLTSGVVTPEDLAAKSSVTVFVSHGHRDHFNAAILRWRVKRKDINFVFSDDIDAAGYAILIGAGNSINISGMKVTAFSSTDIGVSFLVEVDGLLIFHAGDLNLWNRQVESMDEKAEKNKFDFRKAKYAFQNALEPLHGYELDIAFFPVDPQIGKNYDSGAIYFAQTFRPRLFVPMHFGKRYDVCENIASRAYVQGMKVFNINARGQQFEYKFP